MRKKSILLKRTESGTLIKAIIWHPNALDEIRAFPVDVRTKLGYQLHLLQKGETLQMPHSRAMKSVAIGTYELRVKSIDGIYRVFYLLKMADGIYVFHAFQKKTQKTPIEEINLGRKRLKELMEN